MTDPKNKSESISETTKVHLIDVYASAVYDRREEAFGKALTKGNQREEDSITLLSLKRKRFFKKNETRLFNQFIQGTPDLYEGESIEKASHIVDIKTSWSLHSFLRSKFKSLDKNYYWQVQGYMDLTGSKSAEVVFCLVNGTAQAIMDEKRRVLWQLGGNETEEYREYAKQIEINHIFDIKQFVDENPGFDFDNDLSRWLDKKLFDIPETERIHSFSIERNEDDISSLYKRIQDCYDWMDVKLFGTLTEKKSLIQSLEDDKERQLMQGA